MSTHKKRSLSNVKVTDALTKDEVTTKKVTPAVSNFIASNNDKGGQAVRGVEFLVEPDACKPWKYHNRDKVWMTPERCADLISSIQKNGQQFPIVARKLENDPDGKAWEIIAGRRRWYACSYLNKQIRVKAFSGGDREAAIIMNLENKDRDDISEFEDALSYKQQLDAGLFQSQEEMASALDLKKSKLSKMLNAAKIQSYPQIMNLFPDITKLKINPIYSLISLVEKNTNNKEVIIRKANNIHEQFIKVGRSISPSTCINMLVKAVSNSKKSSVRVPKKYSYKGKDTLKIQYDERNRLQVLFIENDLLKIAPEEVADFVRDSLKDYITTPVS